MTTKRLTLLALALAAVLVGAIGAFLLPPAESPLSGQPIFSPTTPESISTDESHFHLPQTAASTSIAKVRQSSNPLAAVKPLQAPRQSGDVFFAVEKTEQPQAGTTTKPNPKESRLAGTSVTSGSVQTPGEGIAQAATFKTAALSTVATPAKPVAPPKAPATLPATAKAPEVTSTTKPAAAPQSTLPKAALPQAVPNPAPIAQAPQPQRRAWPKGNLTPEEQLYRMQVGWQQFNAELHEYGVKVMSGEAQ